MESPSRSKKHSTDLASLAESIREGGPAAENLLKRIPVDVMVILILDHLDGNDVFALCQTSKYFEQNFCSQDPRHIWQQLWHRDITSRSLFKGLSPSQRGTLYRAIYLWLFGGFERQDFSQQQALIIAVRKDYEKYVDSHLPKIEKQIRKVIRAAIANKSLDVIKVLYAREITDVNFILVAASVGDTDFIDRILIDIKKKYPKELNEYIGSTFIGAARGDQLGLLEELLERFPDVDVDEFVDAAVDGKSRTVIKWMVDERGVAADNVLRSAVAGDDLDMVKYAVQLGATNLNDALEFAAQTYSKNRLPIIKFLVDQGANDYQGALAAIQAMQTIGENLEYEVDPAIIEYLEEKMMGLP